MTKKELLIDYLCDLYECDLVDIHNEISDSNYDYEAHIYHIDDFDDYAANLSPSEIVNYTEDFNINDEWFQDTCYGFESFYNATDKVDTDELAQYILDDNDSYGNDYIQSFLDDYADYDEDDEIEEIA